MLRQVRSPARRLRLAAALVALVFAAPLLGAGPSREPATVVAVVDGDTLKVRTGHGRVEIVRTIGLNTPETKDPRRPVQCFGREASRKARELLAGRQVSLEVDPSQGERDRYGRLLRYVWLPDGRNFAEVMIADGFGFEYTYRIPYRYQEPFKAAERAARAAGRGLWASTTCGGRLIDAPDGGRGPATAAGPAPHGQSGAGGPGDAQAASPCRPGQIKGNRNSGVYHVPGSPSYARTRADVACFDSEAAAAAAGFRPPRR